MGERPTAASRAGAERGRRRWHFAGTVLDERTLELLVNGVPAELERKPLEVLIYLLEHAGEVCTKDELLNGVWPGRILSETVLTKCIGRLREVLGDRDQDIIKTAYGFGYRLIAPVRIDIGSTPEPARLDFKPGDHPPARPLWTLIERLGVGGHGEAWRARHDKTHEQRVFTFALDEASLGALKREITLFRIINDSLADRARIVRLLDWNLEQLPYFTEAEYLAVGSLVEWAQGRGGIAAIPVAERLEVVAKIASALAAVHSVGVIHKDLKPSNIFVKPVAGQPVDIALGNFGSGGMLDAAHVDRLGITRLGFTGTIAASDMSSAAPLYLAPEILNGQPPTVKSDIYALAVILYQFLTADLYKSMPAEWEHDVDDELLREDLALVAHANPLLRLADADILAQRLRSLEERRANLILQLKAQAKTEHTRRDAARMKARRVVVALAFAALIAGVLVSTGMYFKLRGDQQHATSAQAQSRAVAEFLSNEVFAAKDNGVELLTRAGADIDRRFAEQPGVASELHYVIGRSLARLYEYPSAVRHLHRALELGRPRSPAGSDAMLRSASELVGIDYELGNLRETMPRYEAILAASEGTSAPSSDALLEIKGSLARGLYLLGHWSRAAQVLENLLGTQGTSSPPSEAVGRTELYLGQVLGDLAKPAEAQVHLRRAIEILTRTIAPVQSVAEARAALGRALADTGQYDDAAVQLDKAQELVASSGAPDAWLAMRPQYFRALLFLQMDAPEKAEAILTDIIASQEAHAPGGALLDRTGPVRQALGEAYGREGKVDAAMGALHGAITVSEHADGAQHPGTLSARLSLAECLVVQGRDAEARGILATPVIDLKALPAVHPIAAQLARVDGFLAQHEGNVEQSRKSFGKSLDILQALYGSRHWRVIRARQEVERATS